MGEVIPLYNYVMTQLSLLIELAKGVQNSSNEALDSCDPKGFRYDPFLINMNEMDNFIFQMGGYMSNIREKMMKVWCLFCQIGRFFASSSFENFLIT